MLKHKNKDLNQPATVGDFQELAQGIGEIVVTKDEFNEYTGKAFKTFASKEDLQELREEMPTKKEMQKIKSDILASNDKLMHEVKAMREEQHAHSLNHKDITEDIQDFKNLKRRISAVEQHTGMEPAPASA